MKINKGRVEAELAKFILDCRRNDLVINQKRLLNFMRIHDHYEVKRLLPKTRKKGRKNKIKYISEVLSMLNKKIEAGVKNAKI